MNTDLVLIFGAFILLAISGLLVFCFTESTGKNTRYARDEEASNQPSNETISNTKQENPVTN
jgi:uncharacterized membrane protein YhaH (DUF805 family)